jgi:hypothetical protein
MVDVRNDPEITALVAEGVLQEERFVIQDLFLERLQAERFRPDERGVARTPAPDLCLNLLEALLQIAVLARQSSEVGLACRSANHLPLTLPPIGKGCLHVELALQQVGVYALSKVDARAREAVEQRAPARALASLERGRRQTCKRSNFMKAHEDFHVRLIVLVH